MAKRVLQAISIAEAGKGAVLPLDAITVGNRYRRDMGDLDELAAAIADVGLLHPVVVRPDGTLVVGERRFRAAQRLGWTEVPVTVVDDLDDDDAVRAELAENAIRKDFLPSEIDAIRRRLEPLEKAEAKRRMSEGGKVWKISTPSKTRDRIGAFAGVSGRTVDKIAKVVEAAKAEPEKYGKLLADMDRTNKVNGPYRRLVNAKQAEGIRREPPPLPSGPFRVAVIDPPWPYEVDDDAPAERGVRPYPTMTIEQICALAVPSMMHQDSLLFLWSTNFHMRQAYKVLDAWGFAERSILTWEKDRIGQGHWLRCQTEHAILAVRGKPLVTLTNQSTILRAPVRGNSEKPREFYDLVESLCPAPSYADSFSRYRHNDRWVCHGDQAPTGFLAAAE